ncbi:MAG: exosortase-associated EpsI family protein [Opitutales bacterium]|nr:exosortase-associated EpsI family protein [Opitutales bacterium]
MKKIFIILLGAFICAVAGTVIYAKWFVESAPRFHGELAKIAPAELPGWTVEEVPIGHTQGMIDYVIKLLKFDQCVSRRYVKGNLAITFYAAYWSPGKRSPIDAGGHNPDACWVDNGWTRIGREFAVSGVKLGDRELRPYEMGLYEREDVQLPVMFWHLVNGDVHAYKDHRQGWENGVAGVFFRLPKRLEDLKRLGLNQRAEQIFMRVSFDGQNLNDVLANPDFHSFMNLLAPLGIFTDQTWDGYSGLSR